MMAKKKTTPKVVVTNKVTPESVEAPALAAEAPPISPVEEMLRQSELLRPSNPRAANALRDKAHKMEN